MLPDGAGGRNARSPWRGLLERAARSAGISVAAVACRRSYADFLAFRQVGMDWYSHLAPNLRAAVGALLVTLGVARELVNGGPGAS
jgi:hypothetical protein